MATPTPVLAVCLPTWRANPQHLAAAVAAACAQADVVVEVLVSSGPDDVEQVDAVLGSLAGTSAVRTVVQRAGQGMVQHWNAAVAASTAPLVLVPGQDDVLRPGLARTHVAVHADPTVALCASAAALVDDHGGAPPSRPGRVHTREAVLAGCGERRFDQAALARVVLRNGNVVGAPSQVTFRREDFDAVGGFDERYEHAADVDLWMRLAARGDAVLLEAVLGSRRVHASAATGEHRRQGAAARDRDRLADDHGGLLDEQVQAQAAVARTRWSVTDAARAASRADLPAVRAHLGSARSSAPRSAWPWWQHLREVATGRNDDA